MFKKHSVTIDLQPWPFLDRPRVLIEHPSPDDALELAAAVRDIGCAVGICRGPDVGADPAARCPLHRLEPCVAVEGADVLVTALDFERDEGREVVRGLRMRYPRVPVIVLTTVGATLELGDVLHGCTVLPIDAAPAHVAAEVRSLVATGA